MTRKYELVTYVIAAALKLYGDWDYVTEVIATENVVPFFHLTVAFAQAPRSPALAEAYYFYFNQDAWFIIHCGLLQLLKDEPVQGQKAEIQAILEFEEWARILCIGEPMN